MGTEKGYALLSVSDALFYCPCCVMEQQNNAIIALQDTVKSLTTQLSELQAKCAQQSPSTAEQPSDTTEQTWTAVVKEGKGPQSNSRGKGKGKGLTNRSGGRKEENAPNRSSPTQTGKGDNGNHNAEQECDPIENGSSSSDEASQESSPITPATNTREGACQGEEKSVGDSESCQCCYSKEHHLPADGICVGQSASQT